MAFVIPYQNQPQLQPNLTEELLRRISDSGVSLPMPQPGQTVRQADQGGMIPPISGPMPQPGQMVFPYPSALEQPGIPMPTLGAVSGPMPEPGQTSEATPQTGPVEGSLEYLNDLGNYWINRGTNLDPGISLMRKYGLLPSLEEGQAQGAEQQGTPIPWDPMAGASDIFKAMSAMGAGGGGGRRGGFDSQDERIDYTQGLPQRASEAGTAKGYGPESKWDYILGALGHGVDTRDSVGQMLLQAGMNIAQGYGAFKEDQRAAEKDKDLRQAGRDENAAQRGFENQMRQYEASIRNHQQLQDSIENGLLVQRSLGPDGRSIQMRARPVTPQAPSAAGMQNQLRMLSAQLAADRPVNIADMVMSGGLPASMPPEQRAAAQTLIMETLKSPEAMEAMAYPQGGEQMLNALIEQQLMANMPELYFSLAQMGQRNNVVDALGGR